MNPIPLSLLSATALLFASFAYAADQATPDEAKALAIKAADYLKAVGADKALPEFNASTGPWIDRDLYVIVSNSDHVVVADGGNKSLIGHMTATLKDVDGVSISAQIEAIKDAGWVKYKWQNRLTKVVQSKEAYWVLVNGYHVGVGAYVK